MSKTTPVNYIHFESINSTNIWTKENASILDPHKISCITANEQSGGKGRFLKKWISPKDCNLYATLFFCLPKHFLYVANISQLLSISCVKCLKKLNFTPQIKWPNDLLLEQKKLGGILCETIQIDPYLGVILGIGLNINMSDALLETIDQPASSLRQVSGKTWPTNQILSSLLSQFIEDLTLFKTEGFAPFQSYYNAHLAFLKEPISWKTENDLLTGISQGVSPEGHLCILLPSGETIQLRSGEIQKGQKK